MHAHGRRSLAFVGLLLNFYEQNLVVIIASADSQFSWTLLFSRFNRCDRAPQRCGSHSHFFCAVVKIQTTRSVVSRQKKPDISPPKEVGHPREGGPLSVFALQGCHLRPPEAGLFFPVGEGTTKGRDLKFWTPIFDRKFL